MADEIGIEEFLNAFLVNAGVRNAMLLQPTDYNETRSTDPISAGKLAAIAAAFPALIISTIRDETVISTRAYTEADIRSKADMGRVLGYPCGDEFEALRSDDPRIRIDIWITLTTGRRLQLFAYVCRSDNAAAFTTATHFAEAAKVAFQANPLTASLVARVEATSRTIFNEIYLMNRLLSGGLREEHRDQVIDYIWNLGLENAGRYRYDFVNPVHRGIMIGLLSVSAHNPSVPFFPLQYRPEKAAVDEITANLDAELERVFATVPAVSAGGRRRTTRRRPGAH